MRFPSHPRLLLCVCAQVAPEVAFLEVTTDLPVITGPIGKREQAGKVPAADSL